VFDELRFFAALEMTGSVEIAMTERITEVPPLPPRAKDAHKGNFGRVLVVGGSRGMIGAPALAANAALRSGAGLVRLAVPASVQLTVASLAPCATSVPLAEDERGCISRAALNAILDALDQSDCLALGPGLGRSGDLQAIVAQVVDQGQLPMVIDADGLNNLADMANTAPQLSDGIVLTPHPGEMKRLWSAYLREELPPERTAQAQKLAARTGAIVVLKGAGTVVADSRRSYVNTTGNPGMATGGTGDVLTGVIAALLGQGLAPFDAAVLGVFVHGLAGDLAAQDLTQVGLIATDLIEWLTRAWARV
jgi:NAD(P)H-hydrate epimerase